MTVKFSETRWYRQSLKKKKKAKASAKVKAKEDADHVREKTARELLAETEKTKSAAESSKMKSQRRL